MISDLTYKVVTYKSIEEVTNEDCIDWAIKMLELEYETPNLIMLAGCVNTNPYLKEYLYNSIKELELELKEGDEAIVSYAYYHIKQIAKGDNVKQNLEVIYKLCQKEGFENDLHDFYFLYWAWNDLDFDDTYPTHYWEGVNKNNIEETVINYSRNWQPKDTSIRL